MDKDQGGRDELQQQEGITRRLKEAREAIGLSQDEVAQALGITRPTVSAIETCKRKVSSVELRDFAKLYRRDYTYLMDGEAPRPSVDTALFRTASSLNDADKEQVLRFAEFLSTASKPPRPKG